MVFHCIRVLEYIGTKAAIERAIAQVRVTSTPFRDIPGVVITEIATTPLTEIHTDGHNNNSQPATIDTNNLAANPILTITGVDTSTTASAVLPTTAISPPSGSLGSGEDEFNRNAS